MRNLQEYPITSKEVISFLTDQVKIEGILAESVPQYGVIDVTLAKTALAVVQAAAIVVHNDIGSTAAELLGKAFDSQNIH